MRLPVPSLVAGALFSSLLNTSLASAQSRSLFTVLSPVKITDITEASVSVDLGGRTDSPPVAGLGDPVAVDTSQSDLQMKLWKVQDTYNFESVIDVRSVNQSMLPTDDHGKMLKEAKSLTERPFIRYFLPGKEPLTIDISCNRKTCRSLWTKIPFEPIKSQNFQVEVNIRGLRGKHWQAGYNQTVFTNIATDKPVMEFPAEKHFPQRVSLFSFGTFWPSTQVTPLQRDNTRVASIEEWFFEKKESTGYRRIRNLTRFALVNGKMDLEISNGDFLEKRETLEGQVLWLLPGQVIKLTNKDKETRAIRVEFEKSSN